MEVDPIPAKEPVEGIHSVPAKEPVEGRKKKG